MYVPQLIGRRRIQHTLERAVWASGLVVVILSVRLVVPDLSGLTEHLVTPDADG
jgi:hypothetical protein